MALNFPASPANGQTYTESGTTWQFDGTAWNIVGTSSTLIVPNVFNTISVTGEDNITPNILQDTLTFVAGANISIATDSVEKTLTITSTASGGGGGATQNLFETIQSDSGSTLANSPTDTLSIIGGSNIGTSIVGDSLTINYNGPAIPSDLTDLTDITAANVSVSNFYEHAICTLRVDNISTSAYTFNSHYSGSNPNIYVLAGTTIAFDLSQIPGHPFEIQDPTSTPYNTGLVHVATDGTVSTGSSAQGKDSGVLYWRIQESISGNYRYQCQNHSSMVGAITIKRLSVV